MLVYGDVETVEASSAACRDIREELAVAARLPSGMKRHAALVRAWVRAGELVQGIADKEQEALGLDSRSPRQDAGARLLLWLAKQIFRSSQGAWAKPAGGDEVEALLEQLDGEAAIRTRRAEGFAIYGVYPETYLMAARRSGLGPDTRVIGIRSIGVSLAALVAAELGTAPALSLRPLGHPFGREVAAAPELLAEIAAARQASFAIVDEGPGLSGSSFGSVAEWLEDNGVAREHIHFFPSHGGDPGAQSSAATRERWSTISRFTTGFDETLLHVDEPAHQLQGWVSDLVGPLDEPLRDISGGQWRAHTRSSEELWPPADPALERRKFLARAKGETWLVKFAGLGQDGPRKLANARRLHAAGFTPEPAGLVYGFLVERWVAGSALSSANVDKDRLIDRLGAYLTARATLLSPSNNGASLDRLREMARHNAATGLGERASARLDPLFAMELADGSLRVETDNRLHAWEWLVTDNGRLLKTDALDHSAGHDLIGCQDIAWDVAGAVMEHDLLHGQAIRLCRAIEEGSGIRIGPERLAAFMPLYLAFQLGLWTMAIDRSGKQETARLRATAQRYRAGLAALV